jgi:AraC-like DNA-binding protein
MFSVETQTSAHFDELTTLQYGWDFSVAQLAPRKQVSSVSFYQTANVGLNWFCYGTAYEHKLHARDGILSFGVFDPDNPPIWAQDRIIPNDALTVFPHDDDITGSSPAGFRGSGVHLSESFVMRLAEQVFRQPLSELMPAAGIYMLNPEKLAALRAELEKWQQLAVFNAGIRSTIVSRREESLAFAVVDALIDEANVVQVSPGKSQHAVARALDLIHDSDLENISAAELSIYAQCSQRTLEKGFLKKFGLTPKKYIKSLRLARVYDGLRDFDAQGCNSIIELAGTHGFWHMGQFAADFRRIYGQLPSDTLENK